MASEAQRLMRPLNILHVLRTPVGGLFRHVLDVTRGQIARGHQVGLVLDSSTGGGAADAVLRDLAPVLALSACAILASNAQSQYSALVDRLRELNKERRSYQIEPAVSEADAQRLWSLEQQISAFFHRGRLLRNAMFLLFAAMMFLLLTSFLIVSTTLFNMGFLGVAAKWIFFLGLLSVFMAVLCLLSEVSQTFLVVKYELGILRRESE